MSILKTNQITDVDSIWQNMLLKFWYKNGSHGWEKIFSLSYLSKSLPKLLSYFENGRDVECVLACMPMLQLCAVIVAWISAN